MTPQHERQLIASIELPAVMDHWDDLMDFIRQQVDDHLKASKQGYGVLLAAEELLSNIVREGGGCETGEAAPTLEDATQIRVSSWLHHQADRDQFEIELQDNGPAFDPHFETIPLEHPDIPMEQRRIGGLGLFLVKNSVENVEYCYENGYNVYRLQSTLSAPAQPS